MPLSWDMSSYDTKLRKLRNYQNFYSHILIDGSSQTFLVISQFFMFFAEMLHISAERHLSKISFSYFYSPWHPQTFGMIKKIGVSPSFTLAVKSTVKRLRSSILYSYKIFEILTDSETWQNSKYSNYCSLGNESLICQKSKSNHCGVLFFYATFSVWF